MFDYERQVFLREAFERTGRAIYGDAWWGDELDAEDPSFRLEVIARRGSIQAELLRLRRIRAASEADNVDASAVERRESSKEAHENSDKTKLLRRELNELPKAGEVSEKWLATFERRMTTEGWLRSAFRRKELMLYSNGSSTIDVARRELEAGFSYSFSLSLIRLPRRVSSRRFSMASVDRVALFKWLHANFADHGNLAADDEEQCLLWLQERAALPKAGGKDSYFAQAKAQFSGLSRRAFDRVWDKAAPKDWSKPGPKAPR